MHKNDIRCTRYYLFQHFPIFGVTPGFEILTRKIALKQTVDSYPVRTVRQIKSLN